jgi:hypothetical protein
LATSPYLTAGSSIASGDTNTDDAYTLDNDSVMELAGIELIGPVTVGSARQKIESIKVKVDGEEISDLVFNELMAPAYNRATETRYPFFGGVGKYANMPEGFCFNLGVPLLMGGSPLDACPKIGPKESLAFEVKAPPDAEGGATINENLIIRASLVEAKTVEVIDRTLTEYGTLSGGAIDQSFSIRDLSGNRTMSVTKTVPLALNKWTSLYGGEAAAKPYVKNYITYAQNNQATTANTAYRFTRDGRNVLRDFMDLGWNLDKDEAVRVTHIGVVEHTNIESMRIWVSGRETPGNDYHVVNPTENMFPMPLDSNAANATYVGPAELPRAELLWNQKAYMELKDDGTSVPAWATGPVTGAMVMLMGKKFEGLEE